MDGKQMGLGTVGDVFKVKFSLRSQDWHPSLSFCLMTRLA
uniref:Uncharacterized protein n=1 Tax=Arundo donax TaxID=35708 RepID=A0A0A9EDQ3_ARUDO